MAKKHSREKITARLERSMTSELPLKITRFPTPGETFNGVVLEIGADWVLLAQLRDGGYVDGYSILRIDTIRTTKVETTFLPFLLAHQVWPPVKPMDSIDLSELATVIADVAEVAGVMSIFEERRRPDSLWIGTPLEFGKKSMWFKTIEPKAVWEDVQIKVKLKNLTRIDFLDDYTNAIFELAGPAPWQDSDPLPMK